MIDFSRNGYHIWKRGKISASADGPVEPPFYWCHTDTRENYLKRGNRRYSETDITYIVNSHQYRSKEFSQIDHTAFKIIICGCSQTFGIGLPLELTYSSVLANLIRTTFDVNVEIINLSIGGRSVDFITRILFQTVPIFHPHYVFCFFPELSRREYIIMPNHHFTTHHFGHWSDMTGNFDKGMTLLSNDIWDFFSFVKNLSMIELTLHDTAWSWDTWAHDWLTHADALGEYCDPTFYRHQKPSIEAYKDKARDNFHIGEIYHSFVAHDLMTDARLLAAIEQYKALNIR